MRRSLLATACGLLLLAFATVALAADAIYLWRIEGEHATLHMTGSVHVGKPEFFPLAAPLEEAFAAADALAVEVDMFAPETAQAAAAIMMKDGLLPGDETLESRLGPDLWQRVVKHAEERDFPLAMYGKFKPGLVAMMLVMDEYPRQGYDPELGIDKHFLDQARAAGKPIRELETVQAQFDLFLQVDDKLDDLLMDEMLEQMDDVKTITDKMITLWQAGDADGMDRLMQEQTGDEPEMVEFYRSLLDDRNVAMADSLDAWLHGDSDVFVVVGAGHFGGEKGLVRLLENKGWDVVQIAR